MTENAVSSYRVNGKTADEWWAVYSELVDNNRTELGVRCEQARNAWRAAHTDRVWDTDRLWEAYRAVQREYELVSARTDIAHAFYVVARYEAVDILTEFLH